MIIFLSFILIPVYKIYGDSNHIADYPNVTYCVIPEMHPGYDSSSDSYKYLTKQLNLKRRCTHIRGSLYIEKLERFENGSDPDLSFLDSIVDISGILRIRSNSVRKIPLGNLKIIRGITTQEKYSLQISHNGKNNIHHIEDLDLHSLRVIMNMSVRINDNIGLGYLLYKVDWRQILANVTTQSAILLGKYNQSHNYSCHESCEYWGNRNGNTTQFCFGPSEKQCQPRTKCESMKGHIWCRFNKGIEERCHHECVGGCFGTYPEECEACTLYKGDKCVSHCNPSNKNQYGENADANDRLIYNTGVLCTSQCPYSLLDQEKLCVYLCDFSNHFKFNNRCVECIDRQCFGQHGDQFLCNLKEINPDYKNGNLIILDGRTLERLSNCTMIVGHIFIKDESFSHHGVTLPMLYENFKNLREVIGGVSFQLLKTEVKNLTFLSNLKEIRATASPHKIHPGLNIFITSIEFFGLKRLETVYGVVNFNTPSGLCYSNTIPWTEITRDTYSVIHCDKKCHPLCTRGCWGPGNTMCYKCQFKEAGEYCVVKCSDAPGYYTGPLSGCKQCHGLCKDNCTGPTTGDCRMCLFAKENGTCVEFCSKHHYPTRTGSDDHIVCQPCHKSCYVENLLNTSHSSSACTGPSDLVGVGGCTKCHRVIRKDNVIRCFVGQCPMGFFETKVSENLKAVTVQHILCESCNPLCGNCNDSSTHRTTCHQCNGFWANELCLATCPIVVDQPARVLEQGDQCPTCHPECSGRCRTENNNATCFRCMNKKIYTDLDQLEFVCVRHCPQWRNYTDYIAGDLVCLTYEQTMQYQQRKRIATVAMGCVACLVIMVTVVVLFFRCKSRRRIIKAELKAFYSNANEPNMKNLQENPARPPNKNRLEMISIKDLILDLKSKPLGAGAFGKVYRAYWKKRGHDGNIHRLDVVVKIINNSSKASTNEFLEEAQIMASVSHRYCLPLIGVCLSLKKPCLVSIFAEYGSLEKYLHQHVMNLASYTLLKWSEQIADGMAYLNMRGIIHRDLAARNILVTSKNIVQITDFGLAKLVDDTDDGIVVKSGRVPIRWLSLETLIFSTYSSASDVWAYGITLWEMFTFGKRPYFDIETCKLKTYLQEGNRLMQPEICTLEVYMVMIKCWLDDPRMRPSFTELTTTFEQFSHNSKRYLCIAMEHDYEYQPTNMNDNHHEEICLNRISADSPYKGSLNSPNGSLDVQSQQSSFNDSPCHMINPSYERGDGELHTILPMRKKRGRNVSFDRLKNFPRFGFSKLLSTKSSDSNNIQFSPSGTFESNKSSCVRYDSTSALLSNQISSECESSPINPQIAKLLKQESVQSPRGNHSPSKQDRLQNFERKLSDKHLKEEAARSCLKLLDQNAGTRSPSLSSFDGSRRPLLAPHSVDIDSKQAQNSPDSGNSHEFEIDDYLVPSRIHSLGYYNLTPSPTDVIKPVIDLSDSNIMVQNVCYNPLIIDDGYLEPTSKTTTTTM